MAVIIKTTPTNAVVNNGTIRVQGFIVAFINEVVADIKLKYPKFHLGSVTLDTDIKRRSHRGGLYRCKGVMMPGINLALRFWSDGYFNHYAKFGPLEFKEYPSFNLDKVIGGFYSDNFEHFIKAIVLHELAHAVQYFRYTCGEPRDKPHGKIFKEEYAELRIKFLNSELPNQKEAIQKMVAKRAAHG